MNNWQNKLLEGSLFLKEPFIMYNAFESSLFSEKDLGNVLRNMSTFHIKKINTRIYVDNGMRHDYETKVYHNPPFEVETVFDWSKRIFGENEFGIVINNVEQLNDSLTQRFAVALQPIIEKIGIPLGGIDTVFFVGNYGYTPFGIHIDDNLANISHFHIGPSEKDMILWDIPTFVEKTGTEESNFDYEMMKEFGTSYNIKSNSIFFMPANYYHVGENKGFSIALTFGFRETTHAELVNDALNQANKYLLDSKKVNKHQLLDDLLADDFIAKEYKNSSLETWVSDAVIDYKYSLESNCGFIFPPAKSSEKYDNIISQSIIINSPFKIFLRNKDNQYINLFVRKNRMSIKYNSKIVEIIRLVNEGNKLDVSDLIKISQPELSEKSVIGLITTLLNHKGIILNE